MASSEVTEPDSASENSENGDQKPNRQLEKKKNEKRGIIYLSTIPKFMTVAKIREIFGQYGEVDRVFLQPEEQTKDEKRKKRPAKHFTEGWVEYKKKRIAKQVAAYLNNKQIGERKRSQFYDFIWNMKYLPRFKWIHLNERLSYERAVRKQRMKTEIAQVKREANFFSHNVDLKAHLAKRKVKGEDTNTDGQTTSQDEGFRVRQYRQRDLDSEIRDKKLTALSSGSIKIKKKKSMDKKPTGPVTEESREGFLKSIFGKRS